MTSLDLPGADSARERHEARAREVDHRVKNTLQLISSLVLLQSRRAPDEATRTAMRSVLQRVAAVGVAHRHVCWDEDGGERVELAALIREIVGDLAGSAGRSGVEIELDLEPVAAPAPQSAPIALLVSETIGNCLRHAYPEGRTGKVSVSLRRTSEGFVLGVVDDGVGCGGDMRAAGGFGLMVAELMARQLQGEFRIASTQPGVQVLVSVPMTTDPRKA